MDMKKILARLDAQLAVQNTTANAVSLKATGSTDTIRNWKRRAKDSKNPGVTTTTLDPVARALNVPLDWLMGNGPDNLDDYLAGISRRDRLMRVYDRLAPREQEIALKQIVALDPEESPQPE